MSSLDSGFNFPKAGARRTSTLKFDFGSIQDRKADLTARQMAILMMEKNRKKDFSLGSFLKNAGERGLNPVLWTFDKLLRPNYAVANATDAAWDSASDGVGLDTVGAALRGAYEGFTGKEKKGFGEVLKEHGVLKGHRRLRGVAGFGLDMGTDPLMLLSIAAAPVTGGSSVAAYSAAKAAAMRAGTSVSRKVVQEAAYDAGRHALKGTVSRDAEEILALAGNDYKYRHALSKLTNDVAEQEDTLKQLGVDGAQLNAATQATRNMLVAAAFAEESRVTQRAIQFKFGLPKNRVPITPTHIMGKRVVPTMPKLANTVSRNIPIVSKLADATGKAFIPGFRREELHAMEISRTHLAEQMHLWNKEMATKKIGDSAKGLSDEEQMRILHLFEKPPKDMPAVVPDGLDYALNEEYIQALKEAGQLNDQGEQFVRNWHDLMETFNRQDQAIGLHYDHIGSKGKLYVPHMFTRGNDEYFSQSQWNILSEAGFTKKRKGDFSVLDIDNMLKEGKFAEDGMMIETRPLNLLVQTSRARAEKYADQAVVNSLVDSFGVGTRTVDGAKLAAKSDEAVEVADRLVAAMRQAAHAEEAYQGKFELLYDDIERSFNERIAKAHANIRKTRAARNKKEVFNQKAYDDAIRRLTRRTKDKARAIAKASKPEYAWRRVKGRYLSPDNKYQITKTVGKDGKPRYTVRDAQGKALKGGVHTSLSAAKAFGSAADNGVLRKELADKLTTNAEREALQLRINHTKTVDVGRSKKATIARLQKTIETLEAKKQAELALVTAGKHPKLNVKAEKEALKTAKQVVREARRDVNRITKEGDKIRKGRPNKAFDPHTMRQLSNSVDEYGNPMALPKDAADVLMRLEKVLVNDDRTLSALGRGYAKYLALWKLLVTSVNPGYRVRNTLTDFWNMYLMGVPIHQIPKSGVTAARVMRTIKSTDLTDPKVVAAWDEIFDAAQHGVLSGLFAGDIQSVAQAIRYAGSKKSLKKKPVRLAIKVAQDINRSAENWGRLTHYMYRRKVLGENIGEASMKVKIAHFDYEDLTPVEQKWMKRIFPFYTWSRKNVPYQLRQIVGEPGRYSAFPKAAMESEEASGGGGEVPGYMSDNFAFRIPFGNNTFYTPQLGMADLAMLQSPGELGDRLTGMITPVAKVPAEIALNRNALTGAEIDSPYHTRTPVTPLGAALLSLVPGSDVGTTERDGVVGPGANPYYAHVMGLVPAARQAFVSSGGIKGQQNPLGKWSWLGGFNLAEIDPDKQAEYTARDLERKYQKWIAGLRDAQLAPREERKQSAFDKTLLRQIQGG